MHISSPFSHVFSPFGIVFPCLLLMLRQGSTLRWSTGKKPVQITLWPVKVWEYRPFLAWRNSLKFDFTFEINRELFAYVTWKTLQYQFSWAFQMKSLFTISKQTDELMLITWVALAPAPIIENYLHMSLGKLYNISFLGFSNEKPFHNFKADWRINAYYLSCSCIWPVQLAFCPMKFWINWTMDQYTKKLVSSPVSPLLLFKRMFCQP